MKNRAKPVAAWETSGRGLKGDPVHLMKECIKPNFPTNIQRELNDLDPETQKEIKALFDYKVKEFENCGEQVFTCDDFDTIQTAYEDISEED